MLRRRRRGPVGQRAGAGLPRSGRRTAPASQVGQFQLRTGGGAWVGKDDPLAREQFVVAADLDGNRTSARIRLGAGLDAAELEAASTNEIERRDSLVWDKQRNDLVHRTETRLGNMTHRRRDPAADAGPGDGRRAARPRPGHSARPAGHGTGRRDCGHASRSCGHDTPTHAWPDLVGRARCWRRSTSGWRRTSVTRIGRADLERLDVAMLLSNQLSWDQQTELAERAPADAGHADGPAGRRSTTRATCRRRRCACRTCSAPPCTRPSTGGAVPHRARAAVARRPPDPDHQRPARVLGGLVGRGAQGDGRPLPQAPVAATTRRPLAPKRPARIADRVRRGLRADAIADRPIGRSTRRRTRRSARASRPNVPPRPDLVATDVALRLARARDAQQRGGRHEERVGAGRSLDLETGAVSHRAQLADAEPAGGVGDLVVAAPQPLAAGLHQAHHAARPGDAGEVARRSPPGRGSSGGTARSRTARRRTSRRRTAGG